MALPLLLRECLYVCMSLNISRAFNYAHEQITIGTPEYDGARTTINIIMISVYQTEKMKLEIF